MSELIDLTGQRFGRWTVLYRVENSRSNARWRCRCDCGTEKDITGYKLRDGNTKSCGCYRKEFNKKHGMIDSPTYKLWSSMLQRCSNPKNKEYKNYGARGITVCDRWKEFKCFFEDMGEKPVGMSIDRVDNNQGYDPSNCKWSTPAEQSQNSRNAKLTMSQAKDIRYFNKVLPMYNNKEIGLIYNVSATAIHNVLTNKTWREA